MQPGRAVRPIHRVCSTPFGITEVGMNGRDRGHSSRLDVLNAFRHHRVGTATGGRATAARCAQRLSASQRWHRSAAMIRADGDVLNAFRHH